MTEEHQYDKDLTSIALITADGYEPLLPLSLVLHIDYEMAPRVVQRFGDVKRLISQTLDPIISAYFRDVAQIDADARPAHAARGDPAPRRPRNSGGASATTTSTASRC